MTDHFKKLMSELNSNTSEQSVVRVMKGLRGLELNLQEPALQKPVDNLLRLLAVYRQTLNTFKRTSTLAEDLDLAKFEGLCVTSQGKLKALNKERKKLKSSIEKGVEQAEQIASLINDVKKLFLLYRNEAYRVSRIFNEWITKVEALKP